MKRILLVTRITKKPFMILASSKNRRGHLRGFTLIELLVVIAIIGILSAVVLAALNTARSKGNDASIKSNLDTIRTQSAIYYDTNNNYGANTAAVSGTNLAGCTTGASTGALAMFGADANVKGALTAVSNVGGASVNCGMTIAGTAWAVWSSLNNTGSGAVWCVDSTGKSQAEAAPAAGATVC
jgi:prepilin-type N-terminal cleavage/methylation domain-containing protein